MGENRQCASDVAGPKRATAAAQGVICLVARAGVRCPHGLRCRGFFGNDRRRCRGEHTAAEWDHFERREAVLQKERGAPCQFCQFGCCRNGDRCRRQQIVDSDYSSGEESSGCSEFRPNRPRYALQDLNLKQATKLLHAETA